MSEPVIVPDPEPLADWLAPGHPLLGREGLRATYARVRRDGRWCWVWVVRWGAT